MPFSDEVLRFLRGLQIMTKIPKGIEVLDPYENAYTFDLCTKFYTRFYNSDAQRTLILGINPGRFGSGTTGISFTDPIKLERICGIPNTLLKKPELSADFIYTMIDAYGGLDRFYARYFISSVCPLGFTKDGKNINYYDDSKLQTAVIPFVVASMNKLVSMGANTEVCYCLGEGKNFAFLSKLNSKHQWFAKIVPLAHPRFIMQYKRKYIQTYVQEYLEKLNVQG